MTDAVLPGLIALSRELGRAERELAILGEGNTSAAAADGTFWVKASGSQLGTIDERGFSQVRLAAVLSLLEPAPADDAAIAAGLRAALLNHAHAMPSVETFLHAVCLAEGGARWVGHTHPIAVNQILCSRLGAEPFRQHLFPDGIVVCGVAPLVLPYVDPGLALGLALRAELRRYHAVYGRDPKLLLLVNHGAVALGQTATDVLNTMLMVDKWARVLVGTYALGGPSFLPPREVERIDSRLDEHYRRSRLSQV